jgi:hypothetical protein
MTAWRSGAEDALSGSPVAVRDCGRRVAQARGQCNFAALDPKRRMTLGTGEKSFDILIREDAKQAVGSREIFVHPTGNILAGSDFPLMHERSESVIAQMSRPPKELWVLDASGHIQGFLSPVIRQRFLARLAAATA